MALSVSFNGATLYVPSSYSKTTIDLGGGLPIGPAGLIAVFGEADAGAPGDAEVDISLNSFNANQLATIRAKYRSGPIVDAAAFLFAPAADAAIPAGAQQIWIYKTNSSVRATLALANSYGTLQAIEWGVGGNRISYSSVLVGETAPMVASSAPFVETSVVSATSFSLHIDGGLVNTFTFPSAPTSNSDLASKLANSANWSAGLPVGITITVGGSSGASTVSFALAAAPTQNQLGFGRSFQLTNVTGTPLTAMNVSAGLKVAAIEPSVTLTLNQKRDLLSVSDTLGGNVVLELGHDGTGAVNTASVTIDATSIILSENGSPVHTLPKASYITLKDLADELNLSTYSGWSAQLTDSTYNQLSVSALDQVTAVGARAEGSVQPARIKKDSYEVASFFGSSSIASISSQAVVGLPNAMVESLLTGGAKGGSTSADMVAALEKFEKIHVNSILPLFSRDATADISDSLTDSSSTYTIAGIHQAVKTHVSLMRTTKKKSERQGYLSIKDSYVNTKKQAGVIADGREQLVIQDIRQVNSQGVIGWFQPWALAALLAGARGGAPIGTPMTYKYLNLSGLRQTAQPMSTPDADIVIDFDPDLQADDAILSGLTFLLSPQTGGFRVVADNTTYGRDENFVYNRANVLYAADIVAYNFRNGMEALYIGQKNNIKQADVIGSATSILGGFLKQGITVATADAPQGFKNLVVSIQGNTIYVDVTIKVIEGIDFALIQLNIQRATT